MEKKFNLSKVYTQKKEILELEMHHVNYSQEYLNNSLFLDLPTHRFYEYNNKPSWFLDKLNSNGYRCENFTKNHNGKHILFSGCSVTWGSGLLLDEIWSKILYEKIQLKEKCSGYFNLAIPGTGIPDQVINIFKYCKEYGNPEYIFIALPDLSRFYFYDKEKDIFYNSFYSEDKSINFVKLFVYQYYFMLDQYCTSNNIKLLSFTYNYPTNKENSFNFLFKNKFKTFHNIDINVLLEYVYNNKNNEYYELARDKEHYGTSYHEYWANFIYSKYLELS